MDKWWGGEARKGDKIVSVVYRSSDIGQGAIAWLKHDHPGIVVEGGYSITVTQTTQPTEGPSKCA